MHIYFNGVHVKKYFFHFLNIIIALALIGCGKEEQSHETDATDHHEEDFHSTIVHLDKHKVFHAGIKTEIVKEKSIAVPLTLPGKVSFDERKVAHITARVAGRIETLHAYTNDNVTARTVVAELYSQDFIALQHEFLQADERLKHAQWSNTEELKTTQALYESAKQKLRILELDETEIAEIESTKTPKQFYPIRAPFNGTVLQSGVKKGMQLQSGDKLFDVADLSTLWVLADVYERDLPFIKIGMKAEVTTSFYPESFYGNITSVYNVVDEKSRTVKARIELNNISRKLKPEMFCTVKIQTHFGKETIKIPSSALLGETEKHFVFIAINDTTFERRDVRTGYETKDFAEVLDGLLIGERIVVRGGFFLKSELAKETFGEEH